MPIVAPTNLDVLTFKGLHLYHSGISNCAMRVRITLDEKGLPWESHHLNIGKREHHTKEYFGINPKGLVPTLVHDGTVITESDDIIDYLDNVFPDPPLSPAGEAEQKLMYRWLHRATSIHVKAVKTHIYEKRMAKTMSQDEAARTHYEQLQTDPELIEFHRKSDNGFSQADIEQAQATLDACFDDLEQLLVDREWIAGGHFSLADIAWMPLYFTLKELAGFLFDNRPNVRAWAERIEARPSFTTAVLDWWPFPVEAKLNAAVN